MSLVEDLKGKVKATETGNISTAHGEAETLEEPTHILVFLFLENQKMHIVPMHLYHRHSRNLCLGPIVGSQQLSSLHQTCSSPHSRLHIGCFFTTEGNFGLDINGNRTYAELGNVCLIDSLTFHRQFGEASVNLSLHLDIGLKVNAKIDHFGLHFGVS